MTAEPRRDEGEPQTCRLLERQVSRRALLTLSLARGAAVAGGQAPEGVDPSKAVPAPEPPRAAPCGACGAHHRLGEVCPVGARQQALARGFGRAPSAVYPAPRLESKELEGGS